MVGRLAAIFQATESQNEELVTWTRTCLVSCRCTLGLGPRHYGGTVLKRSRLLYHERQWKGLWGANSDRPSPFSGV